MSTSSEISPNSGTAKLRWSLTVTLTDAPETLDVVPLLLPTWATATAYAPPPGPRPWNRTLNLWKRVEVLAPSSIKTLILPIILLALRTNTNDELQNLSWVFLNFCGFVKNKHIQSVPNFRVLKGDIKNVFRLMHLKVFICCVSFKL